ncbi:response regulator [Carboxylicivirga sp. N1Y90]|uniref:response regulator n=1 Tax=Carboxylicivirga fragile TaxID=3417571 RepID=UPI003D33543F|nr:response regulator [Marinilabiliaceae bacterium N1Y90]
MMILLLEDTQTDANLVIHMLKKAYPNVIIHHAKTVNEARELLKNDFDLALLDMQLPDGNGIEILKEIRQTLKDMAVAMLTGSGDEEVAVAALKAGADDYMVKTTDFSDRLEQTVEFAIKNHLENTKRSSTDINLMYIEHNPTDIDLTLRHLTRYAPFILLENARSGEIALELLPEEKDLTIPCKYDVIVMDYRLPGLNALEFIKIIRQDRKLDIPIIVVTGQGNEEVAVQALKLGANDYLVKRQNYLQRLPSLILSAFQYVELERKQAKIAESETKYRLLAENSGDVIFTLDFDLNYTFVSPAIYSLRGFTPEEIIYKNISSSLTPLSFKKVEDIYTSLLLAIKEKEASIDPMEVELEAYCKDGTTI